ncbi:glutathione S-transferase family protein [Oceanibium sediminis]|uniref:glutathione S-transferase family protein n=1 Tax=Oceanibium sediminis TaxID=2026339 RepID=UPI000DD3214C|nr:glutathione S-transferase family protein [Oceanibium sediminis]
MYTLYWEQMAGSIVVQAMLESIGADYDLRYVDMGAGEHQAPAFLKINPAARIPVLGLPGGRALGETAAIVTLLGERHPQSGLTPQPGDPDRAAFLFWLSVMATAGYITSGRVGHPERFARDDSAIAQVKAQGDADYVTFFDLMERSIEGDGHFLARGLGALDFYVAMLAEWISDRDGVLAERPALRKLCDRVRDTAPYAAALKTHMIPAASALA